MLQEAVGLAVVAGKFLDNVGAHVAVFLLDLLCGLQAAVGLATVTKQALHEVGDVSTGNGYTLNGGTDDVAFRDGDNMGHTVTGVDDSSGQGSVGHFRGRPGCSQRKDGLDGDVETSAVERLEHDLGGVLTVLGGIQGLSPLLSAMPNSQPQLSTMKASGITSSMMGKLAYRLSKKEVVILGLNPEVLEDRLGPEPFHRVPILNLTMTNRILEVVSRAVGSSQSFVSDRVIQVLRTTLH